MNNHYILSFFFLFFTLNLSAQTETCLHNLNDANIHNISQVVDGVTFQREYILHIPSNYDASNPTPLVINLHGFGDCASDYAESVGEFYGFNALADEQTFIVAYPQGAYRPEKEDTYWEPGDPGVDHIYENDVFFFEELISTIDEAYNLDLDKVYACGYSNGGMMAYSLACNRSSMFSAIGIMSGTMLEETCDLEVPVPIIKFHGIGDGVLPYQGSYWYQSVDEVVSYWLDQNGIPASSLVSTELSGGNVVHDKYAGGDDDSCLSLYTINEEFDKPGDHVWFSEEIESLSPNQIMWNFFEANCAVVNAVDNLETGIFSLYPNPSTSMIQIDPKGDFNFSWNLYSLTGESILLNQETNQINVSSFASGVYLLEIYDEDAKQISFEKIVVAK